VLKPQKIAQNFRGKYEKNNDINVKLTWSNGRKYRGYATEDVQEEG
jgi:hypothetical protein